MDGEGKRGVKGREGSVLAGKKGYAYRWEKGRKKTKRKKEKRKKKKRKERIKDREKRELESHGSILLTGGA